MQAPLPKELEEFIQEVLADGVYPARDEIIHDALWLLRDRYALYKVKRDELRQLLDVGIRQVERGEVVEGELVFARLMEKVRQRSEQAP